MSGEAAANSGNSGDAAHEVAWLLGQPPLHKYLDFVKHMTVNGAQAPTAVLVDEWRTANDYYYELEEREAGIADAVEIRELDPALAPLAEKVMADPRYRRTFDTVPTRFAMVELDRLVIVHHINLQHTERLKARLGGSPTPEALFHFCLPLDRSEAPVQMRRVGPRRFMFSSQSRDFRFQEAVPFGPEQIKGYDPFGPVGGILGLLVGYGSNFFNVIQSDNRLVVHNGHHRAYALRELGITHAPCIVQTVTRRDELNVTAAAVVIEDPAFYFRAKRPPLLKDFFDPKIRRVLRAHDITKVVEISVEVNTFEIKPFGSAG